MPRKKTHRRSASVKRGGKKQGKKSRRSASVKRGGYYGATGAITPGAMEWGRGSEMGDFAISTRGANAMFGAARSKRKTKRRSASKRGGASYGAVSASYQGTGTRGMIDVVPTTTKYPPFGGSTHGAFNNAGAQPGSGFASFIRAH
jgi:hypothetical protein